MADTTGPILAIGGITLANQTLLNGKPLDLRVAVATGLAAGAFALLEKAWKEGAVALAYVALVTVLLTRVDPTVPSPTESLDRWWNSRK